MKKTAQFIILLILPVIFILVSILSLNFKGEFFLRLYDPSYVYLINSLNLAQLNGYGVGHIDHPGTPAQVIGAVVIYLLHLSNGVNKDIVTDVFSRPEFYISNIYLVFIFINSIALYILGFVTLKKLKDIYPAIILQITPFFLMTIYYFITNFSPEPLLIFSVLIFLAIIISYTSEEDLKTRNIIKYVVGFGLICGFGLATKITFFPLLIIPIVLINRISNKLLFCFITFIAFLIFVFPALSPDNSYEFLGWLKNLSTHSGRHGTGQENFIDNYQFLKNLKTLFRYEPVFIYSYILISLAFLLMLIPKLRKKIKSNKYNKLLIGIFGAMTIQLLIVGKHFGFHYLLPSYMLVILGLYIVNSITINLFPNLFKVNKHIYLFIILIIFLLIQIKTVLSSNSHVTKGRNESRNIVKFLEENYNQSIIVTSYGASSKEFALYLGASYGGSQKYHYYSILRNMYPNCYYYDIWSKSIENVEDKNTVKNNLINSKTFVFQCDNETALNDFMEIVKGITLKQNATFKNVFSNYRGETIYEINLGPD